MRAALAPLLAVCIFVSSGCKTTEGAQKKDEPPPWLIPTAFCLSCVGVPVFALGAMLLLKPNEKVEGYTAKMDKSPYSGKEVGHLFDVLYKKWDAKFHNGDKIRPLMDRMDIHWIVGIPDAKGTPVVDDPYGRGKTAGFFDAPGSDTFINRGRMRVTWYDGFPLAKTALAHELVHGFLLITTGDAGNDHLNNPKGVWTLEVQGVVNDVMRELLEEAGPQAPPEPQEVEEPEDPNEDADDVSVTVPT